MNPEQELNLGNSIFERLNDRNGLMICGYEWGWSKEDEQNEQEGNIEFIPNAVCAFADKTPKMGTRAKTIRYDNAIKTWFELWGHPLDCNSLGGNFEKSIVQTNWADTLNNNMGGDYQRLLETEHVDNFIRHIDILRPKLILLMGSKLLDFLNSPHVLSRFEAVMGLAEKPQSIQKEIQNATHFRIGFQNFERCKVACFPHPSASRGLSYEYIAQFKPEMDKLLQEFKAGLPKETK